MRYLVSILVFLLSALFSSAQENDSTLARMNAVKLSPDYIYGSCTMPDEEGSRIEALADLGHRVEAFLLENNTSFVRSLEQCPEEMVKWLTYRKGKKYVRSLAYVEKKTLLDLERELEYAYENKGIREAVAKFKQQLADIKSVDELMDLIAAFREEAGENGLKYGSLTSPQDDSYLVYYEKTTGKILLIRTPMNDERIRMDARLGTPSLPRKGSPNESIIWVYIDEPKK
jgi:hypothetical protein